MKPLPLVRPTAGPGKRRTAGKLTVHRLALVLFVGALVIMFSSISLFLGVLHSMDSSMEETAEMPSLSIFALNALQQAKMRGLHGSLSKSLQKPPKVCVDEHEDLKLTARFLIPGTSAILEVIPEGVEAGIGIFTQTFTPKASPSPRPVIDNDKDRTVSRTKPSNIRDANSQPALHEYSVESGSGSRSGPRKSVKNENPFMQTWFEKRKLCKRWVCKLSKLLQAAGNDSLILGLEYNLGSDGNEEPTREGWNNKTANLEVAMIEVEPLRMALGFWGHSSSGQESLVREEGSGKKDVRGIWPFRVEEKKVESTPIFQEIVRVETLMRPARQQMEMASSLLALAPEKAELVAVEVCGPPNLPMVEVDTTRGLGIHLSLFHPTNASSVPVTLSNVERILSGVKKRCELRQAPLLRYVVPSSGAFQLSEGLGDMPFPLGQLAVSWESNCNVVHHRVIICRGGDVGLCSELEEKDCSMVEDPAACLAEQESLNHTRSHWHYPDITVTTISTKQVSPTSWVHSALFPPLQPGPYRYRVRSGGKWSHQYVFRVVTFPQLPKLTLKEGDDKEEKGAKIYTTRGGHLRLPTGPKGNVKEGSIGKKGALGRKGYQRGPIGVSPVDTRADDWTHIALVSDTQGGVSVFRKHLAHIRHHKPAADLFVHLGDRVQRGESQLEWANNWYLPLWDSKVGQYAAHLGVVGNHDQDDLGLASAFAPLAARGNWYSIVIGNCLWIALDSNASPLSDPGQTKWLRQTLEELAMARKEGTAPSFTIVMVHIAPFIEFWDPKTWVKKEERRWGEWVRVDWVPLFEKYKVDLVISGHSHVYQRGERNGVMYAILGGGGGALDKKRVENWKMYKVTSHEHHFVWVDLSAGKLSWTAYDLSNNPIDHVLFEAESFESQ